MTKLGNDLVGEFQTVSKAVTKLWGIEDPQSEVGLALAIRDA
jgi:hypothetical protein